MGKLFKDTIYAFMEDQAMNMSAALAYYAITSFAPLMILAVTIFGFIAGPSASEIVDSVRRSAGDVAAQAVQSVINGSGRAAASIISFILLILSSIALFTYLRQAMNIIWKGKEEEAETTKQTIWLFIKQELFAFVLIFGMIVFLFVFVTASGIWASIGKNIGLGSFISNLINYVVLFIFLGFFLSLLYKILPNRDIKLSEVWRGGMTTAALIVVGQVVVTLYLSYASVGSAYGSAGLLLLLLVDVYYIGLTFFFGAELSHLMYERGRGRAQ